MSAGSKKMGRNPFERKAASPAAAAAPQARPAMTGAEEPRAEAAGGRAGFGWEERIEAAHEEIQASSCLRGRVERTVEWALVDLPADAILLALRSFARLRG